MWEDLKVEMGRWPDLSNAAEGDSIYYCYECTYQNNVTQNGTGPSFCRHCRKDLRVWKVEPGEKDKQRMKNEDQGYSDRIAEEWKHFKFQV